MADDQQRYRAPQQDADSGSIDLSVVIPVYNEAAIMAGAVEELIAGLRGHRPEMTFEVILAENGSSDGTAEKAQVLTATYPELQVLSLPEPNYGAALRRGILTARGRFVICDEIDLCDLDFYDRALPLLESDQADLVIGSKAMPGAQDTRPMIRRAATQVINGMLRILLGFHGTDTHGLKAFQSERLATVARQCRVERDLFSSEFVIRAQRARIRVTEIPIHIQEKRTPSIHLFRRVPRVLSNLAYLFYALRIRKEDASNERRQPDGHDAADQKDEPHTPDQEDERDALPRPGEPNEKSKS
ncbi:MAG: glycosyltransferase [Deltaproteobacteria bacterium]|nr:glycosyltransferase [Deltaproteobacteria bacterium]